MIARPLSRFPIVLIPVVLFLLGACAKCPVPCQEPYEVRDLVINDLRDIPQNLDFFAQQAGGDTPLLTPARQGELMDVF